MLAPEPGNKVKIMRYTLQPKPHEVLLTVYDCAVVLSYASHLGGSWFCTQLGDRVFLGFS
jgi:hypothetical protein